MKTLDFLLARSPCKIEDILANTAENTPLQEGTALNRVRELRYLGAVTKVGELYHVRPTINSTKDFKEHIYERLNTHVVVRTLRKSTKDLITSDDVVEALQLNFRGYDFTKKTWDTYANYFVSWLRFAGIDFGRRLVDSSLISAASDAFTPQWRPEKDIEIFLSFRNKDDVEVVKEIRKGLYDLKALGLLTYQGTKIILTKRGKILLRSDEKSIRRDIARFALDIPKIYRSYEALQKSKDNNSKFEDILSPILNAIPSPSYRKVTMNVLRSWGKFVSDELEVPDTVQQQLNLT